MSVSRFALLVGLALGAIWGFTENFGWTLLAGILAGVGYAIGLVIEGRINVDSDFFSSSSSSSSTPTDRTSSPL